MKISITIFIFLSFISYVINDHPFEGCGSGTITSAADCKDDNIDPDDKKAGYVKCCLLELKKNEYGKSCIAITEKQGKKLGTIIKEYEKAMYYAYDISIDCKSSYLKTGLVLLISFIIF